MGIAVITTQGDSKYKFVSDLNKRTGGGVQLLIIKKSKHLSFLERIRNFLKTPNDKILRELRYAILLRLNKKVRKSLEYFRESNAMATKEKLPIPKVMEVDSVNSDEVYNAMRDVAPEILVIWGSEIIKPHILNSAKKAVNLHMGTCPYYRGNLCNQFAVLNNDFSKIGATIHYAVEKVDSGKIISLIQADTSKPPRELFLDLNNRAQEKYLEVIEKIFRGEEISGEAQDLSLGKNFTLKQWTRETRYNLGKKILKWESDGIKVFE